MIREQDLLEAIAECQGERDPNANTCIKLAAYYTILNNLTSQQPRIEDGYSRSEPPTGYDSGSEFSEVIRDKDMMDVLDIMDELMDTIQILSPRLYKATLEKLQNL